MLTKTEIEKYFNGEKAESRLFMAAGAAAIVAAVVFLIAMKQAFYNGAAIPMLFIGALLFIVGFTVYKRSDEDRKRNVYAYDMDPAALKDKELPRMQKVMKNFIIYRWVEIFLLLAGIGLYIYFIRDFKHDFRRGFGLALAIMSLIALTADFFAERRGRIYIKGLEEFVK